MFHQRSLAQRRPSGSKGRGWLHFHPHTVGYTLFTESQLASRNRRSGLMWCTSGHGMFQNANERIPRSPPCGENTISGITRNPCLVTTRHRWHHPRRRFLRRERHRGWLWAPHVRWRVCVRPAAFTASQVCRPRASRSSLRALKITRHGIPYTPVGSRERRGCG